MFQSVMEIRTSLIAIFIFIILFQGISWKSLASDKEFINSPPEVRRLLPEFNGILDCTRPSIAAKALSFESNLLKKSKEFECDLSSNDAPSRERAAKMKIYLALYMTNLNYSAENGVESLKGLRSQLADRDQKIIEYLIAAGAALQSYPRVWAWLEGAKINLARHRGLSSAGAADDLIATAEKFPDFNLLSLLITTRPIELTSEQRKRVLKVVEDQLSGRLQSHHSGAPYSRGLIAPFTGETGLILLADFLVGESYRLGRDAHGLAQQPARAKMLAADAIKIYQKVLAQKESREWSIVNNIEQRLQFAKNSTETAQDPAVFFNYGCRRYGTFTCAKAKSSSEPPV